MGLGLGSHGIEIPVPTPGLRCYVLRSREKTGLIKRIIKYRILEKFQKRTSCSYENEGLV